MNSSIQIHQTPLPWYREEKKQVEDGAHSFELNFNVTTEIEHTGRVCFGYSASVLRS
jgi:hypothetical protein